jgi:hypothetical protein
MIKVYKTCYYFSARSIVVLTSSMRLPYAFWLPKPETRVRNGHEFIVKRTSRRAHLLTIQDLF